MRAFKRAASFGASDFRPSRLVACNLKPQSRLDKKLFQTTYLDF
jgi:hypothetical protein